MFVGVNLDAKPSGSTVICRRERGLFHLDGCNKGEDADEWQDARVVQNAPRSIYFDAPLSLPAANFGKGKDHIFRHALRGAVTGHWHPRA